MKKAVPFYRVSTDDQEDSGLGLEAQRQIVEVYAKANKLQLLEAFVEIESGGKVDRPILEDALRTCKKNHAVLLISKLDRLARSVATIALIIRTKVEFIAVDNPTREKFMTYMQAVFGEYERDQISFRTKAALAVAKQRGVQLGRFGKEVLAQRNKDRANEFALKLEPVITELQLAGHKTVRDILKMLRRKHIAPYKGRPYRWHLRSVHNLLKRIESLKAK